MGLFLGHNKAVFISTFLTNKNGIFIVSVTGGIIRVSVDGYGTQTGSAPTFDMTGNTIDRKVTIEKISGGIGQIDIASQNIIGVLDLSRLTSCSYFNLHTNPELTEIINPASIVNITKYFAYGCALTSMDFSPFINFGGTIRLPGMPSLTSVIFPISSGNEIGELWLNNNDIASIDMTGLTKSSTSWFFLDANPNCNSIILPTIAGAEYVRFHTTNSGYVDLTKITGTINYLEFYSCGISSAEADEMIVTIDTSVDVAIAVSMAGTNGALTDGSISGFDGLSAKDSLISKGVTVTYN